MQRHFLLLLAFALPTFAIAADDANVRKLIAQLGSESFEEREQAMVALDAIGEPALVGLRKAAESDDIEVRRRAGELILRIEKRVASANAIKPTLVKLALKDALLYDALAELRKQSKVNMQLHDPEGKLKEKRISLETGNVSFWEAFDRLATEAKLAETSAPPAPAGGIIARPPLRIAPPAPAFPGAMPALPPVLPLPPMLPPGNDAIPARQRVAIEPALTLTAGPRVATPTAYAGAVRMKITPTAQATGEISLGMSVSAEPKLLWQGLEGVHVDRAIDDLGQKLIQGAEPNDPANAVADRAIRSAGNFRSYANVINLIAGEKKSRVLRELRGKLVVRVWSDPTSMITATDLLKLGEATVKADSGATLNVLDATRNDHDQLTIRFSYQLPQGVLRGAVASGGPRLAVPAGFPPPAALADAKIDAPIGSTPVVSDGWSLTDGNGNPIARISTSMNFRRDRTGVHQEMMLTFQLQKDQQPGQLKFSGRKALSVEIPFSFADVPLP